MRGGLVNLIALAILIALIWFGGGYIELGTPLRIGLIAGVLGIWLLIFLYQRWRAIRTAQMIEARLREQAAGQLAAGADPDALSDLQRRLDEAMTGLRQSGIGKSALATLPWYIIIGPPGSGKSTALTASGLEFPKVGTGLNGIQGVGGTRNCEWWFTNEGILLDTAGRYTSVEDDREEWVGFLDMIKSARSRTPINGVIVAISVADLATASEEELNGHAKNVRARLDELCQRLETVFPVYLLFTKCDLLTGFVDFFEDLTRAEREQVWGFTFPFKPMNAERYQQIFRRELQGLYERVARKRLQLLTTERPLEKQQQVYSFPLQLASVEEQLNSFLGKVFRENPYQETAILRGFYFSSGTQEGNPIDQVMASMRAAFGIQPGAVAAGQEPPREKKSYFLTGLFRKLIFPDSVLARSLASAEKRRRATHLAMISGGVAASLLFVVGLLTSFIGNRSVALRAESGVQAVRAAQADPNTPALERLGSLELLRESVHELHGYEAQLVPPLRLSFGLYSADELFGPTRALYYAELRAVLLGPARAALEAELAEWIDPKTDTKALKERYGFQHDQELYDGLYRLLRVYKMLGDDLPLEVEEVKTQLTARNRWLRGLGVGPKDDFPADSKTLALTQLDELLAQADFRYEWKTAQDAGLVHEVKAKLQANYWVSQSYHQIRDTQLSSTESESLTSLFGEGAAVFAPVSSVSKVFTKSQWDNYFKDAVLEKSRYLADQYKEMREPKSQSEIEGELKNHFVSEGRDRWGEFLRGIAVKPFAGVEEGTERLKLLGSPRSPLPKLFGEVWLLQFVLDEPTERVKLVPRLPPNVKKEEDKPVADWHGQMQEQFAKLGLAMDELSRLPAGERLYGRALGNTLSELDPVRTAYQEVEKALLDVVIPQCPAVQEEFVRKVALEVLAAARAGIAAEAQAEANAAWAKDVQGVYAARFEGRYPFAEAAGDETPVEDFVRLLKPQGGSLWAAVQAHERLAAYKIGGAGLIRSGVRYAGAVKDAARLRDALFGADGALALELKVKPYKRTGVKNVRFSLGKDSITENDLPPNRRHTMTWGLERGAKVALLGVDQTEWALVDNGNSVWGLVRLLAAGTRDAEASKDDRVRYTWSFELAGEQRLADVEFMVEREPARALFDRTLFAGHTPLPQRIEQ